jgi:ABC-2 type transport system ATP-binding protein
VNVIETEGLGRRFGTQWALRECTLTIPQGHLVALVGPNGAGKSTLLNLVMGLTTPTAGRVTVLGGLPAGSPGALDGIGYVAQDMPLHRSYSVGDTVHLARNLNRHFDSAYARRRLAELGLADRQKAGSLSGGQRAQLALTLALARHPSLLVLDEPTAPLDPLARHDFMATVMTAMAEDGLTVVLSSHLLSELERVADHLVLIAGGLVRVDGDVDDLLAGHRMVTTLRSDAPPPGLGGHRVQCRGSADAPADPAPRGRRTARPRRRGAVGRHRGAGHGLPPGECAAAPPRPGRSNPMTTLAAAPRAEIRAVSWSRLTWVVVRRYRSTLLGVGVLVGLLAAYLLITGHATHAAYEKVAACRPPADSPSCQLRWNEFVSTRGQQGVIGALLLFVPGLVGAFVGAQALGRELESGVYRFTWTQGVGRMRWALAMIVPAAVGVAVVLGGLGLVVSWANRPLIESGFTHRLEPSLFPTAGVAVVGWGLLAFSGGVLAGLLLRRVIPAILSTFAVWFGLAYLASRVRLHLLTPLTTTHDLGATDIELKLGWTKNGVAVGYAELNKALESLGATVSGDGIRTQVGRGGQGGQDPLVYLREHGYRMLHTYQPDSRYWPLQWIEVGWLVALSVALVGMALWLLQRRSA